MASTVGIMTCQMLCIASLTARPNDDGTSVSVNAKLTWEGDPTRTMSLQVPAGSQAADVVAFLNSAHLQSGAPINEAMGIVDNIAQVVTQFAWLRKIPSHVSSISAITAELGTCRNMLQQAKDALTYDSLSGDDTISRASQNRIQRMEQAEAAARRGEVLINAVLRTLEIGSTITNAQHRSWTRSVSFSRFKIGVFAEGFRIGLFI